MNAGMDIGFSLGCVRCKYCGEKFSYNDYHMGQRLVALEEKRKHESVCPVRFGLEVCPKEWKETLERYNNGIKDCEREIKESEKAMETEVMSPSLREIIQYFIKMKKMEIEAYRGEL